MSSPTSLSLAALRATGWQPDVVERTFRLGPRTFKRDLFGFIDVVAVKEGDTVGVQCCRAGDLATRRTKILESPLYPVVVSAGWSVEIHGWQRPGSACRRWRVRVVNVATGDDTGLMEPPREKKPKKKIPGQLEIGAST